MGMQRRDFLARLFLRRSFFEKSPVHEFVFRDVVGDLQLLLRQPDFGIKTALRDKTVYIQRTEREVVDFHRSVSADVQDVERVRARLRTAMLRNISGSLG